MIKKLLAIMLAVVVAISMVGCGSTEGKIKPAKYKGVVVYKDDIKVTDKDVDSTINNVISQSAKEKKVKKGKVGASDKVNVDYKGEIEYKGKKEAFEGGTAKKQDIDLSQDAQNYIEGFTSSLVGHKVGDKFTAKMKFPASYTNEATVKGKKVSLAGKPVWFTFKINTLTKKDVPKLTDSFVKKSAKSMFQITDEKITTVKALKKYVKKQMRDYNIWSKVWPKITEGTKVVKYDPKKLKKEKKNQEEQQLAAAQQQGIAMTVDDYLKATQMKRKDWNKKITEAAKSVLKEKMLIEKIAKDENINVSAKEYKKKGAEYAKQQGTTLKELEKNMGKSEIKLSILFEKVREYIIDNIKEKKGSEPTTTPAPMTTKKAAKKAKK